MSEEPRHDHRPEDDAHRHQARRMAWGWWVFAAIALFYLLAEHRAHFFGILPFLFLLACPLMHRFMHGHHGGHAHHDHEKNEAGKK